MELLDAEQLKGEIKLDGTSGRLVEAFSMALSLLSIALICCSKLNRLFLPGCLGIKNC